MKRTGVLLMSGALLVAACSDDNSDGAATTVDATEAPTTEAPAATTADVPATTTEPELEVSTVEITELPGIEDTSNEPLPDSVDVRTGTLDNGLTYYVKHNDRPGDKVSLWLAVDAGSTDELTDTTGVAHFAEHMMFNGTERYPENELVDVLRSFGAEFGPDVNAYTSWSETVYQLTVPADDDAVDQGLTVLEEWLNAATITDADTVAERGVVLDEWRRRTQTVDGRLQRLATDHFLAGTGYAGRSPIGERADIETMAAETLRGYYDRWYRPDNVAIVAVGDTDVDAMETEIRERFGDSAPRGDGELADDEPVVFEPWTEPGFVLHADPDQESVDVEVTLPLPAIDGNGTFALRASLIDRAIFNTLVRRLDRDIAAGTAPFDRISPGTNSSVPELDAPALYAFTDAERVEDTLGALVLEYERAFRHGFTEQELAQVVAQLRSDTESMLAQDGERQDAEYADQFSQHFLDNAPSTRIGDLVAATLTELDAITTADLDRRFAARWTNTAPQVIVSTPAAVEGEMPSRRRVVEIIDGTPDAKVPPRETLGELPERLMERPEGPEPTGSSALHDYDWDLFAPEMYTYPNGARVVISPNDIVPNEVYLQAFSPGGSAMVDDADVVDALYATSVVQSSGVADYNAAEFAEIVSSTEVDLDASIRPYEDAFTGTASGDDLEAMLQQVHLYMADPRFDGAALEREIRREQPVVDDPSVSPQRAGTDALVDTRYQGQLRYTVIPEPDHFETLDLEGVERVWRSRFGNASDWTFIIAGDIEPDEALDLTDAYIGTLPGDGTVEEPPGVAPPVPAGISDVDVTAGSGDTGTVRMLFTSDVDEISIGNQLLVDFTTAIIDARLTRVIREEFGDSYSPSVRSHLAQDPGAQVQTWVTVSGAPGRLDAIAETVVAQLADLQGGGLSADEYANSAQPVIESNDFVNNGEFIRELKRATGVDGYDLEDYLFKHEELDAIDRDDVVTFMNDHIDVENHVKVETRPRD